MALEAAPGAHAAAAAFAAAAGDVTSSAAAASAAVCWKGTHVRGVGKPISWCNTTQHLQKSGALCYPDCKAATPPFDGVGPVCWQECKPGYVDEGALCRKDGSIITYAKASYGRGAGYPLTCPPDTQEDAALCYPLCPAGYYGVGPVCWESCPADHPVDGGALCCDNKADCTSKIEALCAGLPLAVAEAILSGGNATKIEQAVITAIEAVLGYVMPLCSAA
uniref:Uncharacterized protein n=1 Tax=Bicosoecida sp. CB-2014 TaxID=1486930 RepID=A0A7S1G8V2_9STRA